MGAVAWVDEVREVLPSAFDGAGFVAMGAVGKGIGCDVGQELDEQSGVCGGAACRDPARQPSRPALAGAGEAQALWINAMEAGGLHHQDADESANDVEDGQFPANHLGRPAARHVHAERGLEAAQVRLGSQRSR